MAFVVKRKPVDYQALASKTYPARLVGVVGIGEQEIEYKGAKELKDQILLVFEIVGRNKLHKDGTPYMIERDGQLVPEPQTVRKECTRSVSPNSNLVACMNVLMGATNGADELEIDKALGAPCLLNLEQRESKTGNQYNSIRDIVPPVDGVEIAQARTPYMNYDVENHDQTAFDALPEWIREVVKRSTQWIDMQANSTAIQTSPPNLQIVDGQTIDTATGEVIAQKGPGF